jgi:hypothetical protein
MDDRDELRSNHFQAQQPLEIIHLTVHDFVDVMFEKVLGSVFNSAMRPEATFATSTN